MAVRPDDQIAGEDDPLFREKGVLDAHFAHFVIMEDVLFLGEIPHEQALLGRLDVLVGDEMVRE